MKNNCILCGDLIPKYRHSQTCQQCYCYSKTHPEGVYPLPPKGEIHYASNGDVICHICGQAHRKLGSHIMNKHKMTQIEYREMFNLYHNTRLSNKKYISNMKELNNVYKDTVVYKNLLEKGVNTRVSAERNTPGRKRQKEIKEVEL